MKTMKSFQSPKARDSVFLFGIVSLSALPYVSGLGFYADDWPYEGTLARASGHGLGAMFHALAAADPHVLFRPVQAAYLVLGFKAFGWNALPYHVVGTAVLGLATICLYFALLEFRSGRWLAFTIAVLFGLLPHYSTDRIWIASQQATLCIAFTMLGLYAMSRSARPDEKHPKGWWVVATFALILSILSYEIAIVLVVAALALIGWRKYESSRNLSKHPLIDLGGIAGAGAAFLLVFFIKARMLAGQNGQKASDALHVSPHIGRDILYAIFEAARFNLWTYGLHMPFVLVSLYRHSALSGAAAITAVVIAGLIAAYLLRYMNPSEIPNLRACLRLIVAGFVLFGLGYALFFLVFYSTKLSNPGIDNRVSIVSALGVPLVLIAMVGLVCSLLRSEAIRIRAFSVAIGLVCGANCLVVSGIAFFWEDAASHQAMVLRSVATHVHSLPPGSVLLLDGFCRYSGPGIVFLADWDTTEAIHLALRDDSLKSDVISPNAQFHNDTVETTFPNNSDEHYPYGNNLFVYNVRPQILTNLSSRAAANAYLRELDPTGDSGCPAFREWVGTKMF